jgi:hypothetical protein
MHGSRVRQHPATTNRLEPYKEALMATLDSTATLPVSLWQITLVLISGMSWGVLALSAGERFL